MSLHCCPICNNENVQVMNGLWNEGFYIKCLVCKRINFEKTEDWLKKIGEFRYTLFQSQQLQLVMNSDRPVHQ